MIYAVTNEADKGALKAALKSSKSAKEYKRFKVIDLSSSGYKVSDIAQILDMSEATIRRLIHSYTKSGQEGLEPNYGKSRHLKLTWSKGEWQDLLAQTPASFKALNSGAQNWTQQLICRYLKVYHDLEVSQMTVSSAIKRAGINWKRARLRVHSPDPLYVVKRQRVDELKERARQGILTSDASSHPRSDEPPKPGRLVFLDSTDLHLCPDIGAAYTSVGEQLKVNSPGSENPWLALFGSLEFPTGEGVYSLHERKRSLEFRDHLQRLIDTDPEAFWFVVLDNASAHRTKHVQAFAQRHQARLELVFLPTYSPRLNLIERLWRLMRSQVTRNHFAASLNALALAVVQWLEKLTFDQFLSLLGCP